MTDELRTWPFCDAKFEVENFNDGCIRVTHPENENCVIGDLDVWTDPMDKVKALFNSRPAEDRLRRRVGELEEALAFINDKCVLYGPADRAREMIRNLLSDKEADDG